MTAPALATAAPILYQVTHETLYDYSNNVTHGQHLAHLSPRDTAAQQVLSHELICTPQPEENLCIRDYFGNYTCSFLVTEPHEQLNVTTHSRIAVRYREPPAAQAARAWEDALHLDPYQIEALDVADMRLPSPHVDCLPVSQKYASRFFTPSRPWLEAMLDLTKHIRAEFTYDPRATTISTPVEEVFRNKRGVCQDFAHLMLSCLRSLKLPARYVSGYILNEPPPGTEKLLGSDASHAWVESWFPDLGWVGFDPTNGKLANHEFITLAWGRDYMDVTPLRGVVLGGGSHTLQVRVSVVRE
ncbi:MAG: transglutaminase family protein [Pseudomonadales bacterium]|jgi:transglutaminase-like putative cysteine protease|nr:transglutaminase family protein [Pseudomonadales bacterium]